MHTFFINTSDKNVDEGKILFDINYENRALVALKCRIEDWPDKEKGYLACVEKMSEMMDMYDDMNKQFNLIIYIDLSAMRKEALEQDTMANDYRGYMEALSIVYCRVMRNTIINALECRSRSPREILIMFGTEEKRIYGADISSPYENDLVIEPLRLFIGLPPDKDIFKLHDDIVSPEHNDEGKMSKALAESCKKKAEYFSAAEIFAEEFLEYCRKAETSCYQEGIHEEYLSFVRTAVSNNQKSRNGTRINTILCPLDNEAEADNKAARTLNSLRIACYILACVYDGTIFDNNTEQKELRSFDALNIEKITEALAEKRSEYVYALISLNEMSSRFSELKLTPVLYSFKGNVFDYNEDGDAISCSVERPVGESKKKKKAERKKRRKKKDISEMEDGRVIESVKRERKNLLKERKVEYFSHAENFSESPEISETAGKYIMRCERLKDFQLGFLKKAQNHILGILSHYAGKSENNTKAILPKRRVSLADPDGGDETRENSYTASKLPEERSCKVSVKTRIGVEFPEEFADILRVYNRYPISEVIIHPRLQKDFYNNHPNLGVFAEALKECVHPVCYNGDIFMVEDYHVFREKFPQVDRIMLGRGVIANPGLVREIRTGQSVTTAELEEYHDRLYAGYREEMDCERDALFKMKEVWFYLGKMFPEAERELKKVKKADRPEEYLAAVRGVFTLPVHALQ